ncbi:hypothetical protein FB567DRAFT_510670 [Paraphoma chrysanthemicola]|uniref:Heterokaryon incompatibility domain-containing protein n=1 Tax=Paraphoma chrysanthemicola TaxID=798071 RepID=A0A8K0W3I1_9PLEO|nr:hypothetical protein FB567DRAFT_510670 [Paraphoma chrysanthemicola]
MPKPLPKMDASHFNRPNENYNRFGMYVYCHEAMNTRRSEIRLVFLLIGERLDPVCCCIITFEMHSAPVHTAVSYTWAAQYADASKSHRVYLDPGSTPECWRSLRVTANCVNTLQQLRQPCAIRLVWIDSICM